LDEAYVLDWGDKRPVLVAVDLGEGQPVAVDNVNEHDQQAVQCWLEPIVQLLGVNVLVTDDLALYRTVARQLNLEHQICQFHVRRWVGKALKELQNTLPKEWQWVLDEIKELIAELPPDGNKRLFALWKQVAVRRGKGVHQLTPVEQVRDLLIRLSEAWENYCTFYSDPEIPWTNNCTEQVIGRMKMRARTVQGYKTWPGIPTGLMLTGTKAN
jgi:transposase-like protein